MPLLLRQGWLSGVVYENPSSRVCFVSTAKSVVSLMDGLRWERNARKSCIL